MKGLFTKIYQVTVVTALFLTVVLSAKAQDIRHTVLSNADASAVAYDNSGNVYVVEPIGATNAANAKAKIVRYTNGTGTATTIYPTGSNTSAILFTNSDATPDQFAFGLAVTANGDVYVTSSWDHNPNDGISFEYGGIFRLAYSSGSDTYSESEIVTGTATSGYYTSIAVDPSNNLFAVEYVADSGNGGDGSFEVMKYAANGSGVPQAGSTTKLYNQLYANAFEGSGYLIMTGLTCDASGNVYVADAYQVNGSDKGHVYKLTASSSYAESVYTTNQATCALGADPTGDVFAINVGTTGAPVTCSLVEYPSGVVANATTLYSNFGEDSNFVPSAIAAVNSTDIFVSDGSEAGGTDGSYVQLIGTPGAQASGVTFSGTTEKGTSISWTNGGGSSRAVFMALNSAGSISLTNSTTYNAATNFGTSSPQAGTGWYCVYNGTGSTNSVNVTGLSANTAYKVMVVEFNGDNTTVDQDYDTNTATNNPNTFTTLTNPVLTASGGSDSYASAGAAVVVDAGITASSGQANYSSATVSISNNFNSGDALNFTNQNGIIGSFTGSTLTLTGSSSAGNYQAALQSITFSSSSSTASTRTISFQVNDGTSTSNTVTKSIGVTVATTLSSIALVDAGANNLSSVDYTVTFAAAVSGLGIGNFTATPVSGSITGASVTAVNGSNPYTVTVNTGSGDGTLRLDLTSTAGLTPGVSNEPYTSGPSYTIDKTVPTVSISAPSVTYINSSASVSYTVTWSDANINSGSESLPAITVYENTVQTGSASLSEIQLTPISGNQTTVTFSGVTGNGTLNWSIPAGSASDNAGNTAGASNTPTPAVIVDNTAPTAISLSATDPTTTNETQLDYQVTFSEPVTGVDASDFTAVTAGGVTAGAISVTPLSSTVYNLSIANVNGNGTLQVNLNSSGTGITDLAGNAIATGISGDTYTVDQTPPAINSITATTPSNATPTSATSVTYTVTFGEAVTGVDAGDFTATESGVSSTGIVVTPTSSSVYSVTINGISGGGSLRLDLNSSGTGIQDLAGNAVSGGFTTGDVYNIDQTPPTATIGAPSVATIGNNGTGTVSYTVTYADANFSTSSLTGAGITLNPTGTATGTVNVSGSGTSYTVTISNITGSGTLGISVAGGYASDQAGNTDAGAGPSTTFAVLSSDANLSGLAVSNVTFTSPFAPGTLSYTATVSNAITSVTVTPASDDPNATIQVNGVTVATGTASASIPLTEGTATVINTVVTAPDGATMQTYSVSISRASSANALLSTIAVSPSPGLTNAGTAGTTTNYTTSVSNATASVTVTPTSNDPNATIKVNGVTVASGTASGGIALAVGQNTINTVVTAQNGTTSRTYLIVVTRAPSSDARMSTIVLSPSPGLTNTGTAGSTTTYASSVINATSSVAVTPTVLDPTATIKVNGTTVASGTASGSIALTVGQTTITTVVTAQDGTTTRTYSIVVTRAPSNNAALSIIALTPPVALTNTGTTGNTTTYTASSSVTSVTVTPTTADPTATVTVNGTTVASGTASGAIALPGGVGTTNTITIISTAQDGTTTHTYSIAITKALSNDAELSTIALTPASLLTNTGTTGSTTTYTTSVSNATTSVTVTPTTEDATATITVNGTTVASGTASGSIALAVGTTTITTVVTAQDGTTTRTYSITVTRASGALLALYQPVQPVSVTKPTDDLSITDDGVMVHQGVSPNGDGINDVLTIDGINQYPDNSLQIIDRNGALLYQAKGYDNTSKAFDGHSNINGKLLQTGTYFYSLDYNVKGESKHKTGFILLKY